MVANYFDRIIDRQPNPTQALQRFLADIKSVSAEDILAAKAGRLADDRLGSLASSLLRSREAWQAVNVWAANQIVFDASSGQSVAPLVKANLAALDKNRDGQLDHDDSARIKAFLLKEGVSHNKVDKVLSEVNDAVSDEFRKMTGVDVGSDPQLNSGNSQQAPKDSGRGK